MKRIVQGIAVVFLGWCVFASVAWADPAMENMNLCVASATSGKDRVELAKWIFSLIAQHPQLKNMTTVTSEQVVVMNKNMARVVTRLVTKDCLAELKDAMKTNPDAMEQSFRSFGILAMQEIMSNPSVSAVSGDYAKYLDKKEFDAAFK
jgi:hypothetical protein